MRRPSHVHAAGAIVLVAVAVPSCAMLRDSETQMRADAQERLSIVAGRVEHEAARSASPWPAGSIAQGSARVVGESRSRSRVVVLRELGQYRGPFDEQSKWFGACLHVTWMANARRVEQVACPVRVLNEPGNPIEDELTIRDFPTTVPRITQGPCDQAPIPEHHVKECGG